LNDRSFSVFIEGPPVPKGRPRFGKGQTYTPAKTRVWEHKAALLIKDAHKGPRWDGPVSLIVRALFPRPLRLTRKKDPPGRLWYEGRTDVDNVIKAVQDAMEKAGVLENDKQIVAGSFLALYAAKDEKPGVFLTWSEITTPYTLEEDR
jgi:Holliday junction resolvase RusA-like endonuclease